MLLVVGTRPEAIKLAPVYRAIKAQGFFRPVLVCTSQHRELLQQALQPFGLMPEVDLQIMTENQTPAQVASHVLRLLPPVLDRWRPDWLLVQGDTTTAFAAAVTAFYHRIPVAHVEAGLRSFRLDAPFPEEFNRRGVAVACSWHFAPTERARANLLAEGISADKISVVGNTVVDAVQWILKQQPLLPADGKRHVLVTLHRRESFGAPLRGLLQALRQVAERHYPHVEVTFPVHPNPQVRGPVLELLRDVRGIRLIPPLDYPDFLQAFRRSRVVLSDSGGVQEEAPSLGVPVLVAREVTERPEAVESGWARLVGTDPQRVVTELEAMLFDDAHWERARGGPNPFGDGNAGERIARTLAEVQRKKEG
ncbi:MAG: UDP-N-acetylglucosamine 2-epimerase (non-hydrolyzing) [Thermoanaerobaculum sp.]|nr:UDP-N-acetylglucosamine 2-epimerase (non-hydrolyzing) [Thermoanaerobaculum sp.]